MSAVSRNQPRARSYVTRGGITIRRSEHSIRYEHAIEPVLDALDEHRGVLLTSSFEYPGRYTRWDMGFINPPLEFVARDREFRLTALNERGIVLLDPVLRALDALDSLSSVARSEETLTGTVAQTDEWFPEELRSKQPSIFSVLRALVDLFHASEDEHLGLYGTFGYELAYQFEPVQQRLERQPDQRDLVLYLPDELFIVDHRRESATIYRYDFGAHGKTTAEMPREGPREIYVPGPPPVERGDHAPGEYAATVRKAIEAFARGDLFEVVPSQTFLESCPAPPSKVYRRLRQRNPSPYGAFFNLGEQEYLVAASPEMYVRVEGRRIETCPIAGTIARGEDAIGDARQILEILNSRKDESELTMCTDVDRNDKSRVCEADSVRVIGRRQIEMYSRLIHTVDHVEGTLREGFDALDGFLAHTWAVTITGAPKQHAIQFIEDHEHSPRRWYGGAMGFIGFSGNMNTGLTLRTVRIKNGVAEVRAGATLLFESDPDAEEAETRLKASALIDAILRGDDEAPVRAGTASLRPGAGRRVLMVDHEDSFVHTLAGYFRRTGAEVITYRSGFDPALLSEANPDLVLLSPGPGRPEDFALKKTIAAILDRNIPLFGVCLGLQGLVEYFGGTLDVLETPMHGKPSTIRVVGGTLLDGLPGEFVAGRYHSLYALKGELPKELVLTAESEDGVVMAIEHRDLPIAAVQFHPESILSADDEVGIRLIRNVMSSLGRPGLESARAVSSAVHRHPAYSRGSP